MSGPERIAHLKLCGIDTTPEKMIEEQVDMLLASLFIPVINDEGKLRAHRDPDRCEHFEVSEDESINWGDLKCVEVKAFADGSYRVVIDEAAPDECPSLCEYIRKHIEAFGWKIECETEW